MFRVTAQDVFLRPLADKSVRLILQLLARFACWLDVSLAARSSPPIAPPSASLAQQPDSRDATTGAESSDQVRLSLQVCRGLFFLPSCACYSLVLFAAHMPPAEVCILRSFSTSRHGMPVPNDASHQTDQEAMRGVSASTASMSLLLDKPVSALARMVNDMVQLHSKAFRNCNLMHSILTIC